MHIVGFHSRALCYRGTTVALYDYAKANEDTCGNVSIIFTKRNHHQTDQEVVVKFQARFTVVFYDEWTEVETYIRNLEITHMYCIKAGPNDSDMTTQVPNIIHAIFECSQLHGIYAFVSQSLATKYNVKWLPHIITPLQYTGGKQFRKSLNIPEDAYVYGRYGGYSEFSVEYVKEVIREDLDKHSNVYFLMCNTDKFITHPRCIFIDKIIDLKKKGTFIDACDAMIHARVDGETFGLSIAEFALGEKMVLTTPAVQGDDNEHIYHLRNRGIVFRNKEELRDVLWKYPHNVPDTPNPYRDFTEEKVMDIFWDLFKN